MATVPYQPVPTVTPEVAPTRPLGISTNEAMFGGNIGQALDSLGHDVGSVGNQLYATAINFQKMELESNINEAVTEHIKQSGELSNSFHLMEGKDPQENLKSYSDQQDQIRTSIRNNLKTDYERKLFDQQTSRRMGYDIQNAGLYAGQQYRKYTHDGREAQIYELTQEMIRNPNKIPDNLEAIKRLSSANSVDDGDPANSPAMKKKVEMSLGNSVDTMFKTQAHSDPDGAISMLEKFKDNIGAAQYKTTLDAIKDISVGVYADTDVARIAPKLGPAGDADKRTVTDMLQEGENASRERFGDDETRRAKYMDDFRAKLSAQTSFRKKEEKDRQTGLENDIAQIQRTRMPNGRYPVDEKEAMSINPNYMDIVEEAKKLNKRIDDKIYSKFIANAQEDIPETSQRYSEYVRLKGLTNDELVKEMDAKGGAQKLFLNGTITKHRADEIDLIEAGARKQAYQHSAVDSALQDSGSLLYAGKIFKSKDDRAADDRYTLMRGAAIMRMEDYVKEHNVQMPIDEQRKMIKELMGKMVTEHGTFFDSHELRYKVEGLPPVPITNKADRDKLQIGQHYMYKGERFIKKDDNPNAP